jgi:hypothetical protein
MNVTPVAGRLLSTGIKFAKVNVVIIGTVLLTVLNGSAKTNCGDIIRQATYHLTKMVNLTPISVTHYDPTDAHNNSVINGMNEVGGLVVNLSADTMEQADTYHELGIAPVTVVLSEDAPNMGNKTPNGLPIVVCPAQTQEDMACNICELCQKRDRKSIVGFKAHGSRRKKLTAKLES